MRMIKIFNSRFAVFCIFLSLACHSSVVNGQSSPVLSEEWLAFFPIITSSIINSNHQYRALVDSVGIEFSSMIKNHNAASLSRIGFVSQEMKDFEYQLRNEIQDRAVETGNYECLIENQRTLENATNVAGNVIIHEATEWYTELHLLNDNFIGSLMHELEILMSFFMVETQNAVSQYNPVTQIEQIIDGLLLEATFFELLFEIYVDEFIEDFTFFQQTTNAKNRRIFRALEDAFENLQETGREIRESLENC